MNWTKSHVKLIVLMILSLSLILWITSSPYFYYFNRINNVKNESNLSVSNCSFNVDDNDCSNTLLIYVYANTHPYAYGNLEYFISNAVKENDGVDYFFILQQIDNKIIDESLLPPLPKSNAFYIQHENKCFDLGTVGWFLNTFTQINQTLPINSRTFPDGKLNLTKYKYFIFMNSSIRGPFFPPYFLKFLLDYQLEFKKMFYWYHIFTKRINSKVKLVGCTISCERTPHVQSYFLVTDLIGLNILLNPPGIFWCYSSIPDVTSNSELPISTRILEAGYQIDSLLARYQTIYFSEQRNRRCNGNASPYPDDFFDGTTLDPYEVIFVKHNAKDRTMAALNRAMLYQNWTIDINKINRSHW